MVLNYYNLREQPFGVTPDSRFLYLSDTHKEALASLLYGIESGLGFIALIAPPGLGKTTLLAHSLKQLRNTTQTVFLFQTIPTPLDLLRAILADLGVEDVRGSLVELQALLNQIVIKQARAGKHLVVLIDEAQNLDESVLEFVRTLSNYETSRTKLIQIILAGQPGLADKIGSPDVVQLRQRISMFACLEPFSPAETALYIDHRLRTAGYDSDSPLFSPEALEMIAHYSEGVPRNINNFCFNSLALACALQRKTVDQEIVREVVGDLDLDRLRKRSVSSFPPAPVWAPAAVRVRASAPAAVAVPDPDVAVAAPPVVEPPPEVTVPSRSPGFWSLPFATRVPAIALGLTVLIVAGGTLFAKYRWPVARAAVQTLPLADRKPQPAPKTTIPAESLLSAFQRTAMADASLFADQLKQPAVSAEVLSDNASASPTLGVANSATSNLSRQPALDTSAVVVTPGHTLIGICTETFGSCNAEILQQIHRLNPKLSNFDHIEPGQTIRIPLVRQTSAAVRGGAEQPESNSLARRGHNE